MGDAVRPGARRTPLLEREGELTALEAAADAAAAGAGSVMVVEAPAGSGKSRLLAVFAERARARGLAVQWGHGDRLGRDVVFGLVRELLADRVPASAVPELADTSARAALELLGLVAAERHTIAQADPGELERSLRRLVFELSASSPQLLLVDDAHWADAASLAFLAHLAARLQASALLIVVATRPERDAAAEPSIRALCRSATSILVPRPLSRAAVGRLVRDVFSDASAELAREFGHASGGNPYLLGELLRELAGRRSAEVVESGAPPVLAPTAEVAQWTVDRIESHGAVGRAIARAVAVLADAAELRRVATLVGEDVERAAPVIDAMVRADLLRPGRPLSFRHPLVAEAVYGAIGERERALLHAAAGRLLWEEHAPPEKVAAQFMLAEPLGQPAAVEVLRGAAARASAAGRHREAASLLDRALAEPPAPASRGAILLALGRALLAAGDARAESVLGDAVTALDAPEGRLAARIELARFLGGSGRVYEAAACLRRGLEAEPAASHEARMMVEAEMLAVARMDPWVAAEAGARLAAVGFGEEVPRSPAGRRLLAFCAQEAAWRCEPAERVVALARAALDTGRLLETETVRSPVVYYAIDALVMYDLLDEGHDALTAVWMEMRRRASPLIVSVAHTSRAFLHFRAGALVQAEADIATAVDAGIEAGLGDDLAGVAGVAVAITAERSAAAARELLARHGLAEGDAPGPFGPLARFARGRVAALEGRAAAAVDDLLGTGRQLKRIGLDTPILWPWRSTAAPLLASLGRHPEARRLAEEELALARRIGTAAPLGVALRALALTRGDERRIEGLGSAVEVLRDAPARVELARALVDLGRLERRRGRGTVARPHLREALELARACGAAALAEDARAELAATGLRVRRPSASGPEALTPRQRRVAELAASGLSNPEIASLLFITRKTVEAHLGAAFRTLDVQTRVSLAAALQVGPSPNSEYHVAPGSFGAQPTPSAERGPASF